MSHQPERTEKNCLNCGADVFGRYCHICGQENIVNKQGFFSLTKHFIYDIFHFDGKFFETLRKLLLHPGRVPKEYTAGKRASFLDPIRMYLFTSAVFFIFFFALAGSGIGKVQPDNFLSADEREELVNDFQKEIKSGNKDSVRLYQHIDLLKDSSKQLKKQDLTDDNDVVKLTKGNYERVSEYDSAQLLLSPEKRDGWITRKLMRKGLEINEKYQDNQDEGVKSFTNTLMHYFPYILFISLPFFAGTLKLLYIRKKIFFYSDHAVFTLYHYVFGFIALLLIFLFDNLNDIWKLGIFNWFISFLVIWWILYLFLGMKRYYQQGWGRTLLKFILQVVLNIIILIFLLSVFFIFSIFQL